MNLPDTPISGLSPGYHPVPTPPRCTTNHDLLLTLVGVLVDRDGVATWEWMCPLCGCTAWSPVSND
jgi:hypothetical protein